MATRDKRLSAFKQDGFPPPGVEVLVLCEDKSGTYIPPFRCTYADGQWYGLNSMLQVAVVGWKLPSPAPFKRDR